MLAHLLQSLRLLFAPLLVLRFPCELPLCANPMLEEVNKPIEFHARWAAVWRCFILPDPLNELNSDELTWFSCVVLAMAVSSGLWLFPEHCWYAWLLIGGMSKTVSVEANVAPNLLAKITSRTWKAPERFPTVNSFLKDFRATVQGITRLMGLICLLILIFFFMLCCRLPLQARNLEV